MPLCSGCTNPPAPPPGLVSIYSIPGRLPVHQGLLPGLLSGTGPPWQVTTGVQREATSTAGHLAQRWTGPTGRKCFLDPTGKRASPCPGLWLVAGAAGGRGLEEGRAWPTQRPQGAWWLSWDTAAFLAPIKARPKSTACFSVGWGSEMGRPSLWLQFSSKGCFLGPTGKSRDAHHFAWGWKDKTEG